MLWLSACILLMSALLGLHIRWAGQERLSRVALYLFVFLLGVGLAFSYLKLQGDIPWLVFLAVVFGGIALGYLVAWLWNVQFSGTAVAAGIKIAVLRIVSDFRISAVLIGLLLSYLLTFYFAKQAALEAQPAFWISFYASWTAGLLLFSVVGLIAGLVTLYRPERDVFLARVKILLGGMTGPVVEYIADEIRKIGYSAEVTSRVITVEDYDESRKAFRVKVEHSTTLQNILQDVTTEAKGRIGITPDKFTELPPLLGQITSFRINGTTQGELPLPIGPAGITREWAVTVPPGSRGTVEYEHWYWYKAEEVHRFTLARFTKQLDVEFRCRCRPAQKRLVLKLTTSIENTEHTLDWDGVYRIPSPLLDQVPGTQPYSFYLGVSA